MLSVFSGAEVIIVLLNRQILTLSLFLVHRELRKFAMPTPTQPTNKLDRQES
jgi:hypothetical protein